MRPCDSPANFMGSRMVRNVLAAFAGEIRECDLSLSFEHRVCLAAALRALWQSCLSQENRIAKKIRTCRKLSF